MHGRSHDTGQRRRRAHFYGCTTRWNRGRSICSNDNVIPVALAEDGVLTALEQQFMHPTIITKAMAQVRAALLHRSTAERPATVARQLASVDAQLERVIDVVQNGGGRSARWSSGCGGWNSVGENSEPSVIASSLRPAPRPLTSWWRSSATSWRPWTNGRHCFAPASRSDAPASRSAVHQAHDVDAARGRARRVLRVHGGMLTRPVGDRDPGQRPSKTPNALAAPRGFDTFAPRLLAGVILVA